MNVLVMNSCSDQQVFSFTFISCWVSFLLLWGILVGAPSNANFHGLVQDLSLFIQLSSLFYIMFDLIFTFFRWLFPGNQRICAALVYDIIIALDPKRRKSYFLLMSPYHIIGKTLIGPVWIMNPSLKERDILALLNESGYWVQTCG